MLLRKNTLNRRAYQRSGSQILLFMKKAIVSLRKTMASGAAHDVPGVRLQAPILDTEPLSSLRVNTSIGLMVAG